MESSILRIGIGVVGLILVVFSFWTHSYKKLAVHYAVIWELVGILMILVATVPILSQWTRMLAPETGLTFFGVGVLILFTQVENSLVISQLTLKNRELAMQVSLLNQESERMMNELEKLSSAQEEEHEEDTVRS